MKVRLPNGTVVQNVPEGTTKEEVARLAVKNGVASAEDFPEIDFEEGGMLDGATEGLGTQIVEGGKNIARGVLQAGFDAASGPEPGSPEYEAARREERNAGLVRRESLESFKEDAFRAPARGMSRELGEDVVESNERVREATPQDMGTVAQGVRSGINSLAEQAPGAILSAITRNPAYMLTNMGVASGGRSYADARAEGLSVDDARRFAAIETGLEVMTERLPAEAFTRIFGDVGESFAKKAGEFLVAEMAGEQIATITQSINAAAHGLDEELEDAYEREDWAAVRDIAADRAAITAVATAVGGGGQIALGKVADKLAGQGRDADIGRELDAALEDADPEVVSRAFREQRNEELRRDEADREAREEGTRRVRETVAERERAAPRGLPNPNPAGADYQTDAEGNTLATGGDRRRASEEALLEENSRRASEGEARRRESEVNETALPNPNPADADILTDREGRSARAEDLGDLTRPQDPAVEDERQARTVGREPVAPRQRESLPRPGESGGVDTVVDPEGRAAPLDRRAEVERRPAPDEGPARRVRRDEPIPTVAPEAQPAPMPTVEPEAQPAEMPKPRMVRAQKASEIYGVDKGGTVVTTEAGTEVLLWKDDGTGMWNVSAPTDAGLPDIFNQPWSRPELIERLQRDYRGMLTAARDPSGRPVATPEQLERVGANEIEASADEPAPGVLDQGSLDDPRLTKAMRNFLERERERVTGFSLEDGQVFIYTDSSVDPADDGSGSFSAASQTQAIKDFYSRVQPRTQPEGATETEGRAQEPDPAPRQDVEITVSRQKLQELRRLAPELDDVAVVDLSGAAPRVGMSMDAADQLIDTLQRVSGKDRRLAQKAIKSLRRGEQLSARQGTASSPYDRDFNDGPVSAVAKREANKIVQDAEVVGNEVTERVYAMFDADPVVEPTGAIAPLEQALSDLERQGLNIEALRDLDFFFYDGGDFTGVWVEESRSLGLDITMVTAARVGSREGQAALRSIIAHELGHFADGKAGGRRGTLSMQHQGMSLSLGEGGSIESAGPAMQEAVDAFMGEGDMATFLEYPFGDVPGMIEDGESLASVQAFVQTEVFAQAHSLYYTDRETLRTQMPQLFSIVEETTNAAGLSDQAGRSDARGEVPVSAEVREADSADGQPRGVSQSRGDRGADRGRDRGGDPARGRDQAQPGSENVDGREESGEGREGAPAAEGARAAGDVVRGRDRRTQGQTDALYREARAAARDPQRNVPLQVAEELHPGFEPNTTARPDPERQSGIARRYEEIQAPSSPAYQETETEREIFRQYQELMPEILEAEGIRSYRDLVEKSYERLGAEVQEQFDAVSERIELEWHEDGSGDYVDSTEMLADILLRDHMWVFQGGDVHPYLGAVDETGLSLNEKFRAVHDYFGHAPSSATFGPQGEERAWANHVQMFSPLARIAMSSETRGQNSWVNYSGANAEANEKFADAAAMRKAYRETGDEAFLERARELGEKGRALFQFAEQKEIALPPADLREAFEDLRAPTISGARRGKPFGLEDRYLITSRGKVDPKRKVIDGANAANIDRVSRELDRVAEAHPDPLESETAWLRFERDMTGTNVVPRAPYAAIRNAQDVGAWAKRMKQMTPDQVAGAAKGFEGLERMKRVYDEGVAQPDTTARVLLWGMLSRRASAYPHEAGYIDLSRSGELDQFIELALTREWGEGDVQRWKAFVQRAIPEGSPGRSVISNANAFGETLLRKMSRRVDGETGLERFHRMISDPSVPTSEVRRQFYAVAPDSGIRNKVISFAMLMTGRTDAMIMDRIQINSLMDWPRYGKLIYDDVAQIYDGAQGLARYEALERSIGARVEELYQKIGRPADASVGRYHWESWVLNSGQVVAHPTFEAIERQALGEAGISDIVAPEGRYTKFAYGSAYGKDDDGNPYFLYPTTDGQTHRFDVASFREMLSEIKNPANGVVPRKFRLDDYSGKGFPWFEAPGVNQEKLNELVRRHGAPEQEEGGARAAAPDEGRAAADGAGQRPEGARGAEPRRDAGVPRDAGQDRSAAVRGQGVPRYGQPVEGAVSVRGRHYSKGRRETLSGAFFGKGMLGQERFRLRNAGAELRHRVNFYVDDGNGVSPEGRVGDVAHEVDLDNIYDTRTKMIDPDDFSPNAFEEEIIRMGFDGYMAPFDGQQRVVVLLGTKHTDVPVTPVDTPKASRRGSRKGAEAYREALRERGLMRDPSQPSTNRFNLDDETRTQLFLRKIQDKMVRLKLVQKRIGEVMGLDALPDEVNAYQQEELFHGRVALDLEDLEHRFIDRLAKVLQQEDLTQAELDVWMYARHARERNAYIASIRDDMPDGGSGMTNAEAQAILQKASTEGKTRGLQRGAAVVDEMLEENRQRLEDAGLLDEETVGAWRRQYEHYVPLRGFAEVDGEPVPRSGGGYSLKGSESLRAMGRRTLASSPTLNAIQDVTEKVVRARKNDIATTFLKMVETYPDESMWKIYRQESQLPKRMDSDGVERPLDPRSTLRVDSGDPRFFGAKVDGKQVWIEIKDPLLNSAMHNAGAEKIDGVTEWLVQTSGRLVRSLSMLNTTLNPEFFVVNAARDIQTALFNVSREQELKDGKAFQKEITRQMVRDLVPSGKAFWRNLRGGQGKTKADQELDRYFREFRDDGAMTGWGTQLSLAEQEKRLRRLGRLASSSKLAQIEKGVRGTIDAVEDFNLAIENAVRLSAYMNARKRGLSRDKAASLAKNLTVNFNRRGEMTTLANSLYMFFNAAIQGNAQIIRSLATNPKKVGGLTIAQKGAASMVGGGVMITLYNAMMSAVDDDDESFYAKIPDYVKERNIVLMLPDGQDYVKIPLPYGYNIFHVTGASVTESFLGEASVGKATTRILHSFFDGFSPLGLPSSESTFGSLRGFAPTLAQPVLELAMNENHFGSQIYRENFPTGTQLPVSSLSSRTTSEIAKATAMWLNDISGGEAKVDGAIDIPPGAMDYLVGFATGGLGRFTMRTIDTGAKAASGEVPEVRQIPFVRQVYGEPQKYENMGRYYDRRHEIDQAFEQLESLRGKERIEWRRGNRDLLKLKPLVDSTEEKLRAIRKERRQLEAMPSTDAVERALERLGEAEFRQYDRLNKAYNKIE